MSRNNFSIQSFRQQPRIDHAGAVVLWNTLRSAIDEIYNQNASQLLYEELYRNAYNLVLHKHYDLLYEGVRNAIRDHLAVSLIAISEAKNDQILGAVVHAWTFHTIAFKMIRDIMMYMDRSYCIPRKKAPVYTLSLQLFRETILYEPIIRERLRFVILQEILTERQGLVIDRPQLKAYLNMLLDLSNIDGIKVYDDEFEKYFLEETKLFYKQESLKFISENTCYDYILKAETRIMEEYERLNNYLSLSTENKLKLIIENELITIHSKTLLEMENTGFINMLNNNKLNELKHFYNLFNKVTICIDLLCDIIYKHIKQLGLDIIANQETKKDPVNFVKLILELKNKYDNIILISFNSDKNIIKTLNKSFENFINISNHCSIYLASYIDELFKGNILQNITEYEIDENLEKILIIFKFLLDKDIFENYYKNLLYKRLLNNKTISDEIEKSMIAKLKSECGYQYTTKLEGMFLDINISKTIQNDFISSLNYKNLKIPMEIHILTTGYWPIIPPPLCKLPLDLQQCISIFTSYYLGLNSGRKLTWLTHLGSVELKVSFLSFILLLYIIYILYIPYTVTVLYYYYYYYYYYFYIV